MIPLVLVVVTMIPKEHVFITIVPLLLVVVTIVPMILIGIMIGRETQQPGLEVWEATCTFPGVILMLTRSHGLWMMQCLLASCVSMVSLLTLLELHVSNVIP